jgi:hypothetical protein
VEESEIEKKGIEDEDDWETKPLKTRNTPKAGKSAVKGGTF